MTPRHVLGCAALAAIVSGCAAPAPVLYPNAHLRQMGQERADVDIADCRRSADAAGASASATGSAQGVVTGTGTGAVLGAAAGAVGGAITGNAGTGAAVGAAGGAAAGLLQSLLSPPQVSTVHKSFVDRCLRERGYELVGWQ